MRCTALVHVEANLETRTFCFWANSPEAPGWTAVADSAQELIELVREGLPFYLDQPVDVEFKVENSSGVERREVVVQTEPGTTLDPGFEISSATTPMAPAFA
jgi:predicted RNase H-like HicB family nuclease